MSKIMKYSATGLLSISTFLSVILQTITVVKNYGVYTKVFYAFSKLSPTQIKEEELNFEKTNKKLNTFLVIVSAFTIISAISKLSLAAVEKNLKYQEQIIIFLSLSLIVNAINTLYITFSKKELSFKEQLTTLILKGIFTFLSVVFSFIVIYHKSINGSMEKKISWIGSSIQKSISHGLEFISNKKNRNLIIIGSIVCLLSLIGSVMFILYEPKKEDDS